MRLLAFVGVSVFLVACATIKQYQTVQQPTGRDLQTYVGGTILRIEKEESLPNAFGGADIYGGRRPKGFTELKYLGVSESGSIKLRVLSTDITTNADWRRRLGRQGTATSSSDAVDFEHDPTQSFEMEGVTIQFFAVEPSRVTYRLVGSLGR